MNNRCAKFDVSNFPPCKDRKDRHDDQTFTKWDDLFYDYNYDYNYCYYNDMIYDMMDYINVRPKADV